MCVVVVAVGQERVAHGLQKAVLNESNIDSSNVSGRDTTLPWDAIPKVFSVSHQAPRQDHRREPWW